MMDGAALDSRHGQRYRSQSAAGLPISSTTAATRCWRRSRTLRLLVTTRENGGHSARRLRQRRHDYAARQAERQASLWRQRQRSPFLLHSQGRREDRLGSKHPTVKPLDLMQYLCRLVTPPGGTILDPFAGTGTTGEAAWREGFRAILIEREAEYQADIARRMDLVLHTKPTPRCRRNAFEHQELSRRDLRHHRSGRQ
jgi:hypothetical protein